MPVISGLSVCTKVCGPRPRWLCEMCSLWRTDSGFGKYRRNDKVVASPIRSVSAIECLDFW